jgi:hypothetical protein
MEPVSIEEPKSGYLKAVRELCDKYRVILVLDEMVTGFRFALGGCQELYGVDADLICLGKALSNGTALAAICGKKEYMKEMENIFFSGTYFSECLSIACSIATMKKLKRIGNKVYPHIWRQGNRINKGLGIDGCMIGLAPRLNVKFGNGDQLIKDLWHQEMIKSGVFLGTQIYVTYATKKKHVDAFMSAVEASLTVVKKAIDSGSVGSFLEGNRSQQVFKRGNDSNT